MMSSAYGCHAYDINRMCRYDRRGIDKNCDGCQRKTDQAYLESNGLWVVGISHHLPVFLDNNGSIERIAA